MPLEGLGDARNVQNSVGLGLTRTRFIFLVEFVSSA